MSARALQLHISDGCLRLGDWLAIFHQSFQMQRDGFTDVAFDLFGGSASGDASWQVRNVGGKIVVALSITIAYFLTIYLPIQPDAGHSNTIRTPIVARLRWLPRNARETCTSLLGATDGSPTPRELRLVVMAPNAE
jgi:hypothetical protein